MATRSFEAALRRLLADEGGYTNHPADPGGPTNYGITLADARAYWRKSATAADMRALPLAVARGIYRQRYWDRLRCDDLPAGLDYAVFDYGVNSGVVRAANVLARLLGLPSPAGRVTDAMIERAARAESKRLIAAIAAERLAFLMSLKTWPVFGRGWGRRVAGMRAAALAMAVGAPPVAITPNTTASAKAMVRGPSRGALGGAGTAAAASTAVALHQGGPAVVAAVAVIGIAMIVLLMLRRWQAARRQHTPMASTRDAVAKGEGLP